MVPMDGAAHATSARQESLLTDLRARRTWRTALYLLLSLIQKPLPLTLQL